MWYTLLTNGGKMLFLLRERKRLMKQICVALILLVTAFICGASLTLRVRALGQDSGCFQSSEPSIPGLQTLNDPETPEQPVYVYSLSPFKNVVPEAAYRKYDLEDALDLETAEKLRAILENAYPYKDLKTLEIQANRYLQSQGLQWIENLSLEEAIQAAQKAIYEAGEEASEDPEGALADLNSQLLYRYFQSLAPERARYDTVSDSTLTSAACTERREADGSFTYFLTVQVDTTVSKQDSLTLAAACGEEIQSQFILETGTYTFTFQNVSEPRDVTLELAGKQYSSDVCFFDSQSPEDADLVGFDSGMYPVYAKCVLTPPFDAVPEEAEDE